MTKPTLEKYWSATSSAERADIIKAAFIELEELRISSKKLDEILETVKSTNRRVAMSL